MIFLFKLRLHRLQASAIRQELRSTRYLVPAVSGRYLQRKACGTATMTLLSHQNRQQQAAA
eukprot:115902-Amphidinium_carterae.1